MTNIYRKLKIYSFSEYETRNNDYHLKTAKLNKPQIQLQLQQLYWFHWFNFRVEQDN